MTPRRAPFHCASLLLLLLSACAVVPRGPAAVIYFDSDHYRVDPQYEPLLASHAQTLKDAPDKRLIVQGHADPQGAAHYNMALARKRAEMVVRRLVSLGVDEQQLVPLAWGDTRPVRRRGSDPFARSRRVELIVVDADDAKRSVAELRAGRGKGPPRP